MIIFQSQFATTLFPLMREYATTGRAYSLPLIADMIRKNPWAFLNEKDNWGNTLFFHLLHLSELATPTMQITIHCHLLQTLADAGISPVNATILVKNPETLYNHLQQLLAIANYNFLSPEKMMGYLLNKDMSSKTPVEIAIESRNPEILRIYLQTLQTVLNPENLLAFTTTCARSGANLLEHIEFHADIHMLLTYVQFLDNAFGSNIAFSILCEQTIDRKQERALLNNLEKTGPYHLSWAISLLQIIDSPEKRWEDLRVIGNAALKLPREGISSVFNFRLFSPPMLSCDTGQAFETNAEIEAQAGQNYWLPTRFLETMEPEEEKFAAPRLN
jgi:hypothetical protein